MTVQRERAAMAIQGWYYLHENGSMIYKTDYPGMAADFRDDPTCPDWLREYRSDEP